MTLSGTDRALGIEYAIRDVIAPARELEADGVDVTRLNIGDPVKFDFDTPEHMTAGFKQALDEGRNAYGASEGVEEFRRTLAEREREKNDASISWEDVYVTTGISEALQMLFGSMLEPGDELLVPGPTYPPYIALSEFYGATPVTYRTIEEEGWRPDVEDLATKITDDTQAIVAINPNNPTGALYPEDTLRAIAEVAAEHDLPIISDEIYDLMTYEGEHTGMAGITDDVPLIVLNGFSKVYLATGWRLGYMYFQDPHGDLEEIRTGVEKMGRVRLCPNTPAQYGALEGVRQEKAYLDGVMDKLRTRRDFFHERVTEIPGLSAQKPTGSFYIFPKIESDAWDSDKQFVLDLLNEAHVLFVHGSGFDPDHGAGHFRSVFLPEKPVLENALDRVESFMRENA
ncbi:MAG: alanine-synthesizing transaminase [Natrialbaceae archaeon]|jgi:alanine-synthesizing transaminase